MRNRPTTPAGAPAPAGRRRSAPTPSPEPGSRPAHRRGAGPPDQGPSAAAPDHDRSDEQAQLVDLAPRPGTPRPGWGRPRAGRSSSRGARARRAPAGDPARRVAVADDHLGAGGLQGSRCARSARPARDDHARGATPIDATSLEPSGSRARESNTTRVGWRTSPRSRAVSRGSSARAVPIPTQTASDSARQR